MSPPLVSGRRCSPPELLSDRQETDHDSRCEKTSPDGHLVVPTRHATAIILSCQFRLDRRRALSSNNSQLSRPHLDALIAAIYFFNSSRTRGARKNNPIILGTNIEKIIASEKPTTEFKLAAAPITTKTQNRAL